MVTLSLFVSTFFCTPVGYGRPALFVERRAREAANAAEAAAQAP